METSDLLVRVLRFFTHPDCKDFFALNKTKLVSRLWYNETKRVIDKYLTKWQKSALMIQDMKRLKEQSMKSDEIQIQNQLDTAMILVSEKVNQLGIQLGIKIIKRVSDCVDGDVFHQYLMISSYYGETFHIFVQTSPIDIILMHLITTVPKFLSTININHIWFIWRSDKVVYFDVNQLPKIKFTIKDSLQSTLMNSLITEIPFYDCAKIMKLNKFDPPLNLGYVEIFSNEVVFLNFDMYNIIFTAVDSSFEKKLFSSSYLHFSFNHPFVKLVILSSQLCLIIDSQGATIFNFVNKQKSDVWSLDPKIFNSFENLKHIYTISETFAILTFSDKQPVVYIIDLINRESKLLFRASNECAFCTLNMGVFFVKDRVVVFLKKNFENNVSFESFVLKVDTKFNQPNQRFVKQHKIYDVPKFDP